MGTPTLELYGPDGRSLIHANPRYVDQEAPDGVLDGFNVTYTLARVPNPPEGLHLFWNGDLVDEGDDYTLDGAVITFSFPPSGGKLRATYRY